MRRADRLFQIIQILRRSGRPVTAAALAAELEVSTRTVYRDIADLVGQRIPIDGEAGVGYLLAAGYHMPPLMFTADELEAVMLGARWVANRPDDVLAKAARDVAAKIAASVPDRLQPLIAEPSVGARPADASTAPAHGASALRAAIRGGRKVRIHYRSEAGADTERTVWPVILGYSESGLLLIAWCELRGDFRHFRVDRIAGAEALEDAVGLRPGELRRRWERWRAARDGAGQRLP